MAEEDQRVEELVGYMQEKSHISEGVGTEELRILVLLPVRGKRRFYILTIMVETPDQLSLLAVEEQDPPGEQAATEEMERVMLMVVQGRQRKAMVQVVEAAVEQLTGRPVETEVQGARASLR